MKFWIFYVFLCKGCFSELGSNSLWRWGNKNKSFAFHWIPITNLFQEFAPQCPPHIPWGGVAKYDLCAVLDTFLISRKMRFFYKLALTLQPWVQQVGEIKVSCTDLNISFNLWENVSWKRLPTTHSPVRDDGLEDITFLNRSGHSIKFLTMFLGDLQSLQALHPN